MPKDEWERFATEDPEFYIYSLPGDWTTEEGRERFFASGQAEVDRIIGECQLYLRRMDLAVEIGCGIGRLTLAMANRFREVRAVDIAPTMLKRLEQECQRRSITNVTTFLSSEKWESEDADLIYSYLVFQHIEGWPVIEDYLARIKKALAVEGVAHLQFDTRKSTMGYHVRKLIPDPFLPRTQRRGIRRVRRSRSDLVAAFERNGLKVIEEMEPSTEVHAFLLGHR